ncbi:penicillin acylase family protein [Piscinibacter sp.]|uniref:penicillin acylase family protein n=1 Tax=Piscinibacter sp. TaxID=1903157 RepID=UPI002D063CCD|nr:penicillin acylase family protein [Albitalea sp.]HUG25353.1 penicillin acylase family protein [Albitalea sp.]
MKWLRRVVIALLAILLAAGVALSFYTRQVLPQTEGTMRLSGLEAEIRIERDGDGIPTITAASTDDALFGLGFVHAQDRLWQLETHRRIGSGRLAEAFGEGALDNDRFLRALGVKRAAAVQWANAGPQAKAAVLAYTAGINAYLQNALKARPPEFVALGLHPEPWTPEDSMAWAIMMAWDLGANWSTELMRMRLSLKLPVARIDELLPPYPGDKPLVTADYAALFRELRIDGKLGNQALRFAPESGVEGVGSNNWVVHGSRSVTGKPLLANDPHLKLSAPALWYFARLEAPGFKVAGATMPALPGVVLGQNEHVAWGFTNTGPDVQDLYLERIKPDDPTKYQTPDGWATFDTVEEVIKVKGRPDVTITARATRHGPVISDAGTVAQGVTGPAARPTYALAMRWTALDPDPGTLDAAIGFNKARSVDEFIAASAGYTVPMQNMVVADRDGHIGFVSAGRVPLRKPENDLKGQVPSPGWDARYDWAGTLDAVLTPRETDPARGWIATANQRIHAAEYAHYLTNDWALPYRQQRIEQLLEAKPQHSLDSFREMQSDELSLATKRLLPVLQRAKSGHPLAAAAQQQLAGFDGTMGADKAAPLIFWSWARHMAQGLFADEIGEPVWERSNRAFRDAVEGVLERNNVWWCDDKRTDQAETCEHQVDLAFTNALDELQAAQGPDVSRWQWGLAHVARAEHRPFSRVKLLARWFELRAPVGGDTYTLNVSRVGLKPDPTTGELYLDEHGPSLRALYDLGDPSQSRFMHSSGQSGIVFSPLYASFLERWAKVEYVPVWGGAVEHTLVLMPQ